MILYVRFAITTPFGIYLQRCFVGFTAELAALFSITNFSKISCRELKSVESLAEKCGTYRMCVRLPDHFYSEIALKSNSPASSISESRTDV